MVAKDDDTDDASCCMAGPQAGRPRGWGARDAKERRLHVLKRTYCSPTSLLIQRLVILDELSPHLTSFKQGRYIMIDVFVEGRILG